MNDFFYDPPYVAISFCKVERAETGWGLVVMCMRLELLEKECQAAVELGQKVSTYDCVRAPLCPDNPTHCLTWNEM
jgi:hypothetical protein